MTRKLLGVWFHLEKNVQGGPATKGGSRTMKYTGVVGYIDVKNKIKI
jgi:hypothetical protein